MLVRFNSSWSAVIFSLSDRNYARLSRNIFHSRFAFSTLKINYYLDRTIYPCGALHLPHYRVCHSTTYFWSNWISIDLIFLNWRRLIVYLMRSIWSLRDVSSGDHGVTLICSPLNLLYAGSINWLRICYSLYSSSQYSCAGGYSSLRSSAKMHWGSLWHFTNVFSDNQYLLTIFGYLNFSLHTGVSII